MAFLQVNYSVGSEMFLHYSATCTLLCKDNKLGHEFLLSSRPSCRAVLYYIEIRAGIFTKHLTSISFNSDHGIPESFSGITRTVAAK